MSVVSTVSALQVFLPPVLLESSLQDAADRCVQFVHCCRTPFQGHMAVCPWVVFQVTDGCSFYQFCCERPCTCLLARMLGVLGTSCHGSPILLPSWLSADIQVVNPTSTIIQPMHKSRSHLTGFWCLLCSSKQEGLASGLAKRPQSFLPDPLAFLLELSATEGA